jgi:hypothetical protein
LTAAIVQNLALDTLSSVSKFVAQVSKLKC